MATTRAATRASSAPLQNPPVNPIKGDVPWRESSFYKEALDNIVSYNSQLLRRRKSRLPYIDAQTGVAQRDCHLWVHSSQRHKGDLPSQIYSYTRRRWRLEDPKPIQEPPKVIPEQPVVETTNNGSSSGLVQALEGGMVTKRSTRIAGLKKEDVVAPTNRVLMESPISSEMNEEDSDKDQDFIDEYESEEEKRQSKKRKRNTRTRTINAPLKYTSKEQEKPYVCPTCNRRYKTQSSLKAHQTQYHAASEPTPPPPPLPPSKLEESKSMMEVTPNPPGVSGPTGPNSSSGVGLKKRNPYCDFCLGDDTMNRKSGKAERMVSCADCGRSAHPSCLQFSPELSMVVLTYTWQCIECKSCSLCGKSDNDDQLLFCDDCDRGYHMYCLTPPMKEAPEGSWSCGMCKRAPHRSGGLPPHIPSFKN